MESLGNQFCGEVIHCLYLKMSTKIATLMNQENQRRRSASTRRKNQNFLKPVFRYLDTVQNKPKLCSN